MHGTPHWVWTAILLLCAADLHAQSRQIEWLVNQGTNHLLSRSHASVGMETKVSCTVAVLHRPKTCAWCDQFAHCKQQTPAPSAPFVGKEDTEVQVTRLPAIDANTRSHAYTSAYFGPSSLRLSNSVTTTFTTRGTSLPSNRGIVESSGEIFFRVPEGSPMNYTLTGELQWVGANGHIQLIGVPNTGANGDGFSFNTNHLPQGRPAPLGKTGSLSAGVYRLFWFLVGDQISHGGSRGASLDLKLDFETCDIVAGKAPPDPRAGEVTGLFGPFDSPDRAIISVEPVIRMATDGDPDRREYGTLVVKDSRSGKYYLTPPVRSTSFDFFNTGRVLLGDDYNRSRDLALAKCKANTPPFSFVAAAHSHPREQLNPLSDNVFSGADFNFAIDDAKSDTRLFDRIYLLPPDRCILSFKAQRGDVRCGPTEKVCKRYYPRVQQVNCRPGALK